MEFTEAKSSILYTYLYIKETNSLKKEELGANKEASEAEN
jgi:hypothetical protein